MQKQKTQIILLTGYLGAGKTTLITHILKEQNKFKVAVIQNEFADEMGIESPLIKDADGKTFDKFYELPNGCICCSAKGELLRAVEFFLNDYPDLDFILVETNGLADPSSTIQQFWVDQELQFPAELRIVHTIVPCHRVKELWSQEIFKRQIVFADTIILNFVDQCQEEQIKEQTLKLREINPTCKIVETSHCNLSLEHIFSGETYKPQLMEINEHHVHPSSSINHVLVNTHDIKTKNEWEQVIGGVLWESGLVILRLKGIVKVKDSDLAYSVQGVNDTFEIQETKTLWSELKDQYGKVLFIGEQLDKEVINGFFTQ